MTQGPPRLRPLDAHRIANSTPVPDTVSDAGLLELLEGALAELPPAERAAAVIAFGLDEGAPGVAAQLEISEADAEALTRNAVQLLRAALADVDLDEGELHARLQRRRRRTTGMEPA